MSSQRRLRLLDFMREYETWSGFVSCPADDNMTLSRLRNQRSGVYIYFVVFAAGSLALHISRVKRCCRRLSGTGARREESGPSARAPTGPSPPLRTSAARGAAAREGGGAGSSHRRCHWLRGTDSCEPAPSRGGRGHGPSLFRHGGRSTVHCVTRGLLAPGWRATRCWNPALDGQNGSRAGRLPPPPWRELCYGSPAPAGRSSVLFPPRHRSAGVVSGRRRCCLQDDPAGAGLAAHQGESGGRLPRYALGRGGGRPPVASTGRAAAWLGWAGAGRAGSGLAWPGLAVRVSWAKGASLSLSPAVHPVLGPAGGDDLRQEAIRWVRRPGRPLPLPRAAHKGTLRGAVRAAQPRARPPLPPSPLQQELPRPCRGGPQRGACRTNGLRQTSNCAFVPAKRFSFSSELAGAGF